MADEGVHLGELIRISRSRAGLTQRQLADFSTVSVRTIRDLERGATETPRRETVQLIAGVLGLDVTMRGRSSVRTWPAPQVRRPPTRSLPDTLAHGRFIGREYLLAALREQLWDGRERLVALTGAPGAGKTRLATELAGAARADGFLVLWHAATGRTPASIAPNPGGSVLAAAAEALLSSAPPRGRDSIGRFAGLVGDAPSLLVLDGLVRAPADAPLRRVLDECAGLRIVFTSLRPRGAPGERVVSVPPFPVAGTRADSERLAEMLGQDGAGGTNPLLDRVAELLDGLPLALRCAAPLLRIYGPETLVKELSTAPLDFLDAHGEPGCRSLRQRFADALAELDRDETELLEQMCRVDGPVTVEELARTQDRALTACGLCMDVLLAGGLVREEGLGRLRPLHLVRALVADGRLDYRGRTSAR